MPVIVSPGTEGTTTRHNRLYDLLTAYVWNQNTATSVTKHTIGRRAHHRFECMGCRRNNVAPHHCKNDVNVQPNTQRAERTGGSPSIVSCKSCADIVGSIAANSAAAALASRPRSIPSEPVGDVCSAAEAATGLPDAPPLGMGGGRPVGGGVAPV